MIEPRESVRIYEGVRINATLTALGIFQLGVRVRYHRHTVLRLT